MREIQVILISGFIIITGLFTQLAFAELETHKMGEPSQLSCRDSWIHNLSFTFFAPYTCAKCFHQVFWGEKQLVFDWSNPLLLHDKSNLSKTYEPDADKAHSQVCKDFLSTHECSKWRECCSSARRCCVRNNKRVVSEPNICPATWDGVACWNSALPNQLLSQPCPTYFEHPEIAWISPAATKQCEENGTWYTHPTHGLEMSDYRQCIDVSINEKIIKISLIVGMTCKSLSILFLVGAIVLTLSLRNLRMELSRNIDTKMHFNLYLALLFMSASWLVMDGVHLVKLLDPYKINNQVWCRIVHSIAKYFLCASYMCLFCEGLHLYRRFTNIMDLGFRDGAFKYYIISWVLPCVFVTAYIIARILTNNTSCWIDYDLGYLELIYFIPNSLTYLCNLYFLIRILISVCRSLRTDTRDRFSKVMRQSIRALFYMIPIFGLQFLFLAYRPMWPPYEIITAVCIGLQGVFATVLYFYTNRDVKTEFKILCASKSTDNFESDLSLKTNANGMNRQRNCSLASTVVTTATYTPARRRSSSALSKFGVSDILKKFSGRQANPSTCKTSRELEINCDSSQEEMQCYEFKKLDQMRSANGYKPETISTNGVRKNKIEIRIKHGSWNGMPSQYSDRSPEGKPIIDLIYQRSNSCDTEAGEDPESQILKCTWNNSEVICQDKAYLTEPLTPILERRLSAESRQGL